MIPALTTVGELHDGNRAAHADFASAAERIDGVAATAQSLEQRLAETEERVGSMAAATDESERRLAERIEEARQQLETEAEQTRHALVEQVDGVESSLAEQVGQSRSLLAEEISKSEQRLGRRIDQADRAGEMEEGLSNLEERVVRANLKATEAHQFSESLRVLQTDLVKAIQSELNAQSTRLDEISASIDSPTPAETTEVGDIARRVDELVAMVDGLNRERSAALDPDRLQAVESRLLETSASVDSLADLQRRTTNLDTSITQSMSNLTEAIESNNAQLAELREQLDAANARIAELESAEPASAFEATGFGVTDDAPEPAAHAPFPLDPSQLIDSTVADEDDDPFGSDESEVESAVDEGPTPDEVENHDAASFAPDDVETDEDTVVSAEAEENLSALAAFLAAEEADDTAAEEEPEAEFEDDSGSTSMPVTDVIGQAIRDEVLTPRDPSKWFGGSTSGDDEPADSDEASEVESDDASPQTSKRKRRFRR